MLGMFWKGDIQGWLATPEWVWCLWDIKQKTMAKWLPEAANRWQGEGKAHSWGQEEPLVGWLLQTVWPCVGKSWPHRVTAWEGASSQIVFTVSMMVLPSVYLQVKEIPSEILQHLKCFIFLQEVMCKYQKNNTECWTMVIATLISPVE